MRGKSKNVQSKLEWDAKRSTKCRSMLLHGVRVLIVEDEPLIAMAATALVMDLGGVVAGTAYSVGSAARMLLTADFDCALLDVNLQHEMSFGIAAELEARGTPFAFCSAYNGDFEGFGHIPRVLKPYSAKSLAAGLGQAIQACVIRTSIPGAN
jgi:CheY-like chemotaxis protein